MKRDNNESEATIFEVLMIEHRDVTALFEQIEACVGESPETARDLFTVLEMSLLAHARSEQTVVYPRLAKIKELADTMLEAEAEHEAVEMLLAQLSGTKPNDEQWLARLTVLKENVRHHVEEEEGEVFPKAKEALDDREAKRLASAYLATKARHTGNDEVAQAAERKEDKRGFLARLLG